MRLLGVGLDSEKRIFGEKMRKEPKQKGKEAIRYGKSAFDIIEFNYSLVYGFGNMIR